MTAPPEPPPGVAEYANAIKAPAHIHELIVNLMRCPPPDPRLHPPGETEARQRALAADQADRIWGEAFHAGATWGLARNTQPIRITVEPNDYEVLVKGGRLTAALTDWPTGTVVADYLKEKNT